MSTILRTYTPKGNGTGFFILAAEAPEEDCGCDTEEPAPLPDGEPDDEGGGGGSEGPIPIESFCPDQILVALTGGAPYMEDDSDVIIGTDTTECADGLHEFTKTIVDDGGMYFQIIDISLPYDGIVFDYTICPAVCNLDENGDPIDYRQDIEFRVFSEVLRSNTYEIIVIVRTCNVNWYFPFNVIGGEGITLHDPPGPPTDLSGCYVSGSGYFGFVITWTPPETTGTQGPVEYYDIWRKLDLDSHWTIIETELPAGPGINSYANVPCPAANLGHYRLRSGNEFGVSAWVQTTIDATDVNNLC